MSEQDDEKKPSENKPKELESMYMPELLNRLGTVMFEIQTTRVIGYADIIGGLEELARRYKWEQGVIWAKQEMVAQNLMEMQVNFPPGGSGKPN